MSYSGDGLSFCYLPKNLMVDWRVPAVQMWALELSGLLGIVDFQEDICISSHMSNWMVTLSLQDDHLGNLMTLCSVVKPGSTFICVFNVDLGAASSKIYLYLMMWCAMSYNSCSLLVFVDIMFNSFIYIQNIVQSVFIQ